MRMSPKEFGERVGRTTRTLQRWAKDGLLVPHRLPSGRPFYDEAHLRFALSLPPDALADVGGPGSLSPAASVNLDPTQES